MPLSRRTLLQWSKGLAFGWAFARFGEARAKMSVPQAPRVRPLRADHLPRFVDPLPLPPLAKIDKGHLQLKMRQVEVQLHRDLKPTRCWSYGETVPGPTVEVRSGVPLTIDWVNDLPTKHFLPIDHNLCGAGKNVPEVRTIAHVHGSRVPPQSDGYPEDWFTKGKSKLGHYPNKQEATTLWYHDHAMGIERLNQYAGLFGAYLIRDEVEDTLALPSGPYELPLFIFDRMLDVDGQLQYPTSGVEGAPWVSEVYGDAILINGKLAPDMAVERRAYRFRVCNASNARFYDLSFANKMSFHQIGSDQGLLPQPVEMNVLTLGPAERVDLIVDFSAHAGESIILMNQAMPLMRFSVGAGAALTAWKPPVQLREVPRTPRSQSVKTRNLSLQEYMDPVTHQMLMLLDDKRWRDPVTEKPLFNSTEIWELVNYTGDTHPIHLHQVRFQILERQHFDIDAYTFDKKMQLVGEPFPPPPNEMGWKDTVQAYPESITRIIVRFDSYAGRYVWHCHLLEHAANEMMRPFEIVRG